MMKLNNVLILVLVLLVTACSIKKEEKSAVPFYTDDLGNKITLESVPQKVVSLAPNITEMIYKLGCGNFLKGNTTFCDYPEEAKYVAKVGDMLSVDFEKLLSIKPDLIFVTVEGNRKEVYDKMISLGFKIFVSNPRNYEGIKKTYKDVASILGKKKIAETETAVWDSTLAEIQKNNNSSSINKVLFLIEIKPVMAAGTSTFLNEYLRLLNLKNITEGVKLNYPVLSRESIVKMNPDIIIYPDDGESDINTIKKSYPEWSRLNAVKNGKVIFADRNLYFRPGPRFIDALKDLNANLHR